jgi:ribonucleoside-diphosphate reductase alpha chain
VHDFEIDTVHDYAVANLGVAHNGGGKRKGSIAAYLEPWHADVMDFLELKLNSGKEEDRARDLFYAMWIPDLFMERVKAHADWTLMCPDECPGLSDVWGAEFEALYTQYEREGRGKRTVRATDIWYKILQCQIETGNPYMLYKDAANRKSNQQNLGTIKSSNLCVAPETLILTEAGYTPISQLAGKDARVWNGEHFANVQVVQTGQSQPLVEVNLSNGVTLHCTPYHKFLVSNGYGDRGLIRECKRVQASDLKAGTKLLKHNFPVTQGYSDLDIPYARSAAHGSNDTSAAPMRASLNCRREWIGGIIEGRGVIAKYGQEDVLEVTSQYGKLLRNVQLVLQTMGVSSTVVPLSDSLPRWKLTVFQRGLSQLVKLGFSFLQQWQQKPYDVAEVGAEEYVTVESVIDHGRVDDTYCFNEPFNHAGVFNGILTGNCTEIMEYTNDEETAVCNLASIALPSYYNRQTKTFDYALLRSKVAQLVRNLNRVIDINFYPVETAKRSNMRHRPVGLGVQGLADLFAMMRVPFDSPEAAQVNREVFENIYYAAVAESVKEAERDGPYETFAGSPASKGQLQFDLWGVQPRETADKLDWATLKADVVAKGMRNSLLLAPMPTASTSQILGFNECFQPFDSMIYTRRTIAGEFQIVNKYLVDELLERGLWSAEMRDRIIAADCGGIAAIEEIPEDVRAIFKTVWEMKQRAIIDMAADRGAFICQSQSMNLFCVDSKFSTLTSMHFYAWSKGLKTGSYYIHTRPASGAQKVTLDPRRLTGSSGAAAATAAALPAVQEVENEDEDSGAECEMCGS